MLSHNLLINTGNILSLNDAKTKTSQNPSDELIEMMKIILRDNQGKGDGSEIIRINGEEDTGVQNADRKELKITVKIFISSPKVESLKEALEQVFNALRTDIIESLIIAYQSRDNSDDVLSSLKCLWTVIEEYVKLGKLCSVGLSDVNTNIFIDLFHWAKVKPNIVQINLATCCVVPPALQAFTKENDVQLLTHSDPSQILPQETLNEMFGSGTSLHWVAKYQIYLKCRGILASKGYLVYINRLNITT